MNQKLGAGMLRALQPNVLRIDARVHVTLAHPDVHVLATGDPTHVRAEKHVRQKQHFLVGGNRVDDLDRVARSTAVVALRFHFRGRVHVRDDDRPRVLCLPFSQLLGIDRRRQRASCRKVGKKHSFLGRQHRCRLGHEVDAAEHDHVRLRLRRFAAQSQRIADEIGDVLHFRSLIIMRENHRVARSRQGLDLFLQLGVQLLRSIYHSMCRPLHFLLARGKSLL